MMITIQGLPMKTRYQDVKALLKSECNIEDFILDNLVTGKEGCKAVRVGLAQESDGYQIIKYLKGYRMSGNVLNVEQVGKSLPSNPPQVSNFESRPNSGYLNQPRNTYTEEHRTPYPGQVAENRDLRFQRPYTGQGSSYPNPPLSQGPAGGPGPVQSSWGAPTQWNPNQNVAASSFGYQQPGNPSYTEQYTANPQRSETGQYVQNRPQINQGFGFAHKGHAPNTADTRHTNTRTHVLRSVDIVDTPKAGHAVPSGRYPANQMYQPQEKPVTIMKDNFQGPTTYNIGSSGTQGPYQKQRQVSPHSWTLQGQQVKPQTYPKLNPGQFEKKYDEVHWDKRVEPRPQPRAEGCKDFEKPGSRFSPRRVIERSLSPSRRLVSPGRRRGSPARQVIATRDFSPRRNSPTARRRVSPSGGRFSPRRLASPSDERHVEQQPETSPRNRTGQRHVPRFSPPRHHTDKPIDKNVTFDTMKVSKHQRPAYETASQAPNQAMYSGGFSSNVHESNQYSRGSRQTEVGTWKTEGGKVFYSTKKYEKEGRGSPPRSAYPEKHSPRKSRSPNLRDDFPVRDQLRKRSASSISPRRSWAFEKRRSPHAHEAPPPPIWPGHDRRDDAHFDRKEAAAKRVPVWESRPLNNPEDSKRVNEKREPYVGSGKYRGEYETNIASSRSERPVEGKSSMKSGGRNEFENKGDSYHQGYDREPKPYSSRQEREYRQSIERENRRLPDDVRRKEPVRREEEVTDFHKSDKDFDMYKRTQHFGQKTEERFIRGRSGERERFPKNMDEKECRHRTATSPRRHGDEPTWSRNIDSHHRVDFSRRQDDMNSNRMEKPRHKLDPSPRRNTDRTSRERRDVSPRHRMDVSPPRHRRGDSPRRHADDTARHPRRAGSPERHSTWSAVDAKRKLHPTLPVYIKVKREKAADEIALKVFNKQPIIYELDEQAKRRVLTELKKVITFRLNELFDGEDVSFIELVIKFQTKVSEKETDRMFNDIVESLPVKCRSWKAVLPDSGMPNKSSMPSAGHNLNQEMIPPRPRLSDANVPDWRLNIDPPKLEIPTSLASIPATITSVPIDNSLLHQQFAIPPLCAAQNIAVPYFKIQRDNLQIDNVAEPNEDGNHLFLRKEDFKPITEKEANSLKAYLISAMIKFSRKGPGSWAPDFTFKGLHSKHRFVLFTRNERSKQWLINLNFSNFKLFNVLIYTQEELWYERAAIWLPGHTKYRDYEPFERLKLQNCKLEGANVGTWKLVKAIVTLKGVRLYVDMPPSSARELEKHNMMLSYELTKVTVYLRATAVDKDVFDAGLAEKSVTDKRALKNAALNCPIPTIQDSSSALKLGAKNFEAMTTTRARQIKESIIRQIMIHHKKNGLSRTDFISYGIIAPSYFGVVPENSQSKTWLTMKFAAPRPFILISNVDEPVYYKISVIVPNEHNITALSILERIKQCNVGIGFDFQNWKALILKLCRDKSQVRLDLQVDIKAIAKLIELDFQLDYMKTFKEIMMIVVKTEIPKEVLIATVKKHNKEMADNYDIANMDLDSETEDDDVICLD